jgi:hypothetical protein
MTGAFAVSSGGKGANPMLKSIAAFCVAVLLCAPLARAADEAAPNTLTDAEKAAGWKLLFDGQTLKGWHGFKMKEPAPNWSAKDGVLTLTPKKETHNPGLVTDDTFENFELSIEWKISPAGNSGIFYRVVDEGGDLNFAGIEYQVLDNEKHPDAKNDPNRHAGAAYYMYPPTKDATKPVGQWNLTRIIVQGNHVQHWLNGEKVVEYDIGSEDWLKRYQLSKFKTHPKYGRVAKGHLALQDHGDGAEYRNIKIKELGEK